MSAASSGQDVAGAEFMARAAPFRAELVAHCYRMLGSAHDAEDTVQETYLRGWRGYGGFQGRASMRTWLYRIATSACLRALENRHRRALPSGLAAPTVDPGAALDEAPGTAWVEPFPDAWWTPPEPEAAVVARQSLRLALVAALQELPARQRAVLILRDVVRFSAAEVAELLDTTPTAVHSALQRAHAHLAAVGPTEDRLAEPGDPARRALVDRYAAAFEHADVAALTRLLRDDVRLEMPPLRTWFSGREDVVAFLASRVLTTPGALHMVPVGANGQPALAAYRHDGQAHALHVLEAADTVQVIVVFLGADQFGPFGLPTGHLP